MSMLHQVVHGKGTSNILQLFVETEIGKYEQNPAMCLPKPQRGFR